MDTVESKNKLVRSITPEELTAFLDELANTPGVDGPMIQAKALEKFDIRIGHESANNFRKEVFGRYIDRLRKRKELSAVIAAHRDADGGRTLADAAGEEMSQLVFEFLTNVEDGEDALDLSNSGDVKKANQLALIISRMRTGDRRMIDQLNERVKELEERETETKKDLSNKQLTEEERAARMRARFGV